MQTAVRVLLTLIVLAAAGFLGYDMVQYYLYSPWTRDARVRADVVTVAPDVSGYVTDLRVLSDQFVKKGDILFVIDQERYRLALADAEATVAARLAQYQMLRDQSERRSKLTLKLSVTPEVLDNALRQAEQALCRRQVMRRHPRLDCECEKKDGARNQWKSHPAVTHNPGQSQKGNS